MQKLRTGPFSCVLPYCEEQLLTTVPELDDMWWQEYFVFSVAAFKTKILCLLGSSFICYWEGWYGNLAVSTRTYLFTGNSSSVNGIPTQK